MTSGENPYTVEDSELLLDCPILAVRRDTINTSTGPAKREILEHFSSVAVAALRDGKLLMIRQYRHGVGRYLWEIPAGLLDMAGEHPLRAAQRELAEEGGFAAARWHLLGDVVTSPGFAEEMCRIYKAEELSEDLSTFDIPVPEGEEADIDKEWVELSQAIEWVKNGTVDNAIAVAAILHLAVGTERCVDEGYNYHSSLAERRAPKANPGDDMKLIVEC
ncbi:NUDIX domain-containing protein [Corynebacterium anserum]|uniref:NUDIX domain-containing protein n=1 Tax=Corynebacterium anserum TaxID=2684406 RepID=A0A7G7YN83_9CORY|nr:NUDIX hydrolase [Corynebacterium anserum]MBC2681495.1 NUDIX domain-containing protein [Corynebacterium anserum]QNH95953.1 NUDIX domain-containing protein [Corynebacterium anserum]